MGLVQSTCRLNNKQYSTVMLHAIAVVLIIAKAGGTVQS